jgi:hypothetical protein
VHPGRLIGVGLPVPPDFRGDPFLQLEVDFATNDKNKTPRLRSVEVYWECIGPIG